MTVLLLIYCCSHYLRGFHVWLFSTLCPSSFGKKKHVALPLDERCIVTVSALPHGDMGWSAVFNQCHEKGMASNELHSLLVSK